MANLCLNALTLPFLLGGIPQMASDEAAVLPVAWSLAQLPVAAQEGQPEPSPNDEADQPANEIIVEGEHGPPEGDPIAAVNEASYRITQQLDNAFVEPIAYAYRDGLPGPIRDGLGNVVRNIGEPNNALNFLLQGKIGKTFETLGRLLVNTTIGVGGLFDIAGRPGIGLPYRRNGWGNTMGFYGVGPGPYLYLPLTGATSVRDVTGSGLDQLFLPIAVGEPFNSVAFALPYFTINSLDARLEVDEELKRIDQTIDPYAARRDSYLYRRAKAIAELRGEEPPPPPAILAEVEGTGEFADPGTPGEPPPTSEQEPGRPISAIEPANPLAITRPR
ncbi:MAG: VacJ family lipoprotein [Erythrobacter sp.]|nr:VacJ family lipoprotein [Erythrobacter sp.]